MKNRILSALLALFSILSVSCGGGEPDPVTTTDGNDTTAPEETQRTDGLPDTDMNGFTLNILHHDNSWLTWAKIDLTADEENGDLINDAIYKRNMYIEDRFNCNLNIVGVPQVANVFKEVVLSGDGSYDIIMQYGINVCGNIEYLSDMNNLSYVNFDADYWNPNATGIFRVGDKQIAAAGNFTLSYMSGSACLLFNKQIYDDLRIADDPYELVRQGKWTVDKFYEIAKQGIADLNGDTQITALDDRKGVTGALRGYYNMLMAGANVRYFEMDKDNYPYFALAENESSINFLQHLLDLATSEPEVFMHDNVTNVWDSMPTLGFEDGGSLFGYYHIFGVTNLRDMQDDFGILPAPMRDENQDKYYSYTNIGEIATLPRSFDPSRADYVGMLMEAMCFYSQENIVPTYKEVVVQTKTTRDEESVEMLDYVFDGISFDYGVVVLANDTSNVLMTDVFRPKATTLVSKLTTMKSKLDAQIGTIIDAVNDMP